MEDTDPQSATQDNKTWLGTSISSLCNGRGPWSFSISPLVVSKYHTVLYQLPVTLQGPPAPHVNGNPHHWDENHVRMPYSEKNLFPVTENGIEVTKLRWNLIKKVLSQPITNSKQLENVVHSYNSNLPKFLALHFFFDEVLGEEEVHYFFADLLPKIIKLALQLPEIVPGHIPLLKKNYNRSVSLSQLQISCLLANAFLCTFPWRRDVTNLFPGVNFSRLYAAYSTESRRYCVAEKIKCVLNYFRRVTEKVPIGVVTFERRFKQKYNMHRWDTSNVILRDTKIHVNSMGTIEDDGLGFLQVDFANKSVGGGVLGYGCVQEEIRFVICPELIISRLFVEKLGDKEAVIVIGPERYSDYSGYSDSFQWSKNVVDPTPYDEYGRRRTSICIIDATHFNKPMDQFYPSAMLRELNKAYCGFSSREKDNLAPVATGNWGCGAFRGNSYLKSLLQLMVCAACGRNMVYYTFQDDELKNKIYDMYSFLSQNKVTISQLWGILSTFSSKNLPEDSLYSFIQQSFFDDQSSRKQPKIKSFFSVNFKKKVNDGASTSDLSKNNSHKNLSHDHTRITEEELYRIDVDGDDIIPGTPEEEIKTKSPPKSKPKCSRESIVDKLPKADIIQLIEAIDGNPNFTAKTSRNTIQESVDYSDNEMVIDTSQEEVISKSASCSDVREIKSSKKKLTDYFQTSFKSS